MPTSENDQTLGIHFWDEPGGADWYEVTIEWNSNQPPPQSSSNAPEPPAGFLLDPRQAKVTDTRGSTFIWNEAVEDNRDGDHLTFGGWEADGDRNDYVAYGRASIRGVMKSG